MKRLVGALFIAFAVATAAEAEQLTIALSAHEVKINSNFSGTSITLFGVIERDAASVSRPGPYEVAAVVLGPPEDVVTRRKDRILGVWANGASATMIQVPSFYAVATSGALSAVTLDSVLRRHGIGFANIGFTYSEDNDPGAGSEFRAAYIRLKEVGNLYSERIGGVTFMSDSVFRADVAIPANVPVGDYTVNVYLFAGSVMVGTAQEKMTVSKSGFEQFMTGVSRNQSLVYGLGCVALALFTGWLAGVIFRRD